MLEKTRKSKFNPWSALENGHHQEITEKIIPPGQSSVEMAALIAAKAFLGQVNDAEELWKLSDSQKTPMQAPHRARARFAIAIAHTRSSRFKRAKHWLRENLTDPGTQNSAETQQGIAVYHYYTGNFARALKHARIALRRSLKIGDRYVEAFATDLYGHSLVQTGKRSLGIRMLDQARAISMRSDSSDPFAIAKLLYEAESGIRHETIIDELYLKLRSLPLEDTFTRSNLVLELARQLTLRGQWQKARFLLDEYSSKIYEFENRRHEATLQLRLAEVEYHRGEASNALHFLQGSRRCLKRIADQIYEMRILGLELKVEKNLLKRAPSLEKTERLRALSESAVNPMNIRILNRENMTTSQAASEGEDPLGDLLDLLVRDRKQGLEGLYQRGHLGLWVEKLGIPPGEERLFLMDDGRWVACSRDKVYRSESKLSKISRQILSELSSGSKSKEQLIKNVWGYQYEPLRHDAVVHAGIAHLRKSLGEFASWVENSDSSWALKCPVLTHPGHDFESTSHAFQVRNQQAPGQDFVSDNSLNLRQLILVKEIFSRPHWTVGQYKERFQVSTMTAWRDLDILEQKGYLKKVGRGRSTCFIQNSDFNLGGLS